MVVCKFFLQGNCRFGANCRNEHPAGQGGSEGGGGFGNQNRFGALSSNTGTNRFGGAADSSKPYNLNPSDIRQDLSRGQGRPQWILSTYGAGRGTPASLFEGNEFSPEELRVRFYEFAAKGQEAQADQEAIQLWTKAESDIDNVASHIDDISKYMEEAENKHPNRYDFLKTDGTKTRDEIVKEAEASNTTTSGFGTSTAFGQSPTSSNPFAKPAAATFGQASAPSAFGASTFGKPAQPSAFGQPAFGQSAFGSSTPAFGQSSTPTSTFGQSNTPSAFGQPSAASAFGKPAFGQATFGQSTFGQTAQPSTTSAFGQSTQQSTTSPFGQPSSTPAFGTSAFSQPTKPNPFGSTSTSSPFGASGSTSSPPVQTTPAFGQSPQPASSFGQSSIFGQPSQPTSAFGQSSQPTSGFGQSAFGQPTQPSAFGQSSFGQAAQPAKSSPFGQAASTAATFGNAGGGASAFGQSIQQTTSPFGQATETKSAEVSMDAEAPAATNTFGVPQTSSTTVQSPTSANFTASAPVAAPAQPNNSTSQTPNPLTLRLPKPLHYTQTLPLAPSQTNMSKRLTQYRNQRVQYLGEDASEVPCYNRPDGKGHERIWYPDAGATQEVVSLNREEKIMDLQEANDRYTEDIKRQYSYLFDEGKFKDGKIPLVPPMRDWCLYDF